MKKSATWPLTVLFYAYLASAPLARAQNELVVTPAMQCRQRPDTTWLLDEKGKVSGSRVHSLLVERLGYAADVTGGAGGKLYVVHSAANDGAGSLRRILEHIGYSGQPGWVIFDVGLSGQTIRLRAELRLPNNLTLDGRCSGVRITAPARENILAVRNTHNIIITGLSLFRSQYRELSRRNRDAIFITGSAGPVWIHRNKFSHCGDGCVDVAMMRPPQRPVRVTISNNTFRHHNKVMLAGVLTCNRNLQQAACRTHLHAETDGLARPLIFLTVANNTFLGTSQRHPKVYSQGHAHVFGNTFALGATEYEDGRRSAVYGVGVDKGGTALVENNTFRLAQGTQRGVAVLNVGSGCVKLEGNHFVKSILSYFNRATGARIPLKCSLPNSSITLNKHGAGPDN